MGSRPTYSSPFYCTAALSTVIWFTWDSLCSPLYKRQLHLLRDLALLQTNPGKYKSIATGFGITYSEGGLKGLVRGWAPTLAGYSIQGAGKFGLYEYFKQ